jgi:DNA-binding MarR family transcriptional regulator
MPTPSAAVNSKKRSSSRAELDPEEPDLDFDPEHRVGHLLRRAYAVAKANSSAALRDVGITPMQAAAVMALRRGGAMSQAELGRLIGMERANVHGLVARLHALDVVETRAHPTDARALEVALSAHGVRCADDVARVSAASAEATLAPLAPHERTTLLALLARIAP